MTKKETVLVIFVTIIVSSHSLPFNQRLHLLGKKISEISAKYHSFINQNQKLKWLETEKDFINSALSKADATFNQDKSKVFEWSCEACKIVVGFVQDLFARNKSEADTVNILTKVCIDLKIENDIICKALCTEFKDEVLTVFDKLALNPDEVCGILFGDSCAHKYNPLSDWNITLPDMPKPPLKPPSPPIPGSPALRVLALSDIHFDPQYKVGSNADCNDPLCCRAGSGPVANGSVPAMKYGDYRNCDTPPQLLNSLFTKQLANETFDYIIWLGDLPPHDVWEQTRESQLEYYKWLLEVLVQNFPNTPIYPALGNHESSPVNSFPPPFIKGKNSISWLYSDLANVWTFKWLPKNTYADIQKGGYYSVLVRPGFRIISINMNYCNEMNWWLLLNMTDPDHELQWLISTLQKAEDNREKVHIIGHIPPGAGDCLKAWSWNYYKIVNRYESTITSQFFGHTHKDSFEIFYDEDNFQRPTSIAYVVPSITTYSYINPGYRVFTVDGDYQNSSRTVLDHETYYLNLTKAHITDNPVWEKEYSAKDAYGLESLNPADWNNLVQKMMLNDSTEFKKYYRYYYKSKEQKKPCDKKCKSSMLCDLKSGRSHDPNLCKELKVSNQSMNKWRKSETLC